MLRDIGHFEARLGSLDGFEDAGEYLRGIVKAKEVASPPPPPAAPVAEQPGETKKAGEAEEKPTEAEKEPEPAKEESNGDTEAKPSDESAVQPLTDKEGTA